MAGENDVIRHVILRILVDQAGLTAELAKARAALKALKDSESASNRDRVKSNDTVTAAIDRQNEALGKNRRAHEDARQAAAGKARESTESVRSETDAIKDQTEELNKQADANARANAERRKDDTASQNAYNRQRKADEDLRREREANARHFASLDDDLNDARMRNARTFADFEEQVDDARTRRQATFTDRLIADFEKIRNASARDTYTTQAEGHRTTRASFDSDTARTGSQNAQNRLNEESAQRRVRTLREQLKLQNDINRADDAGRLAEQRIAEATERRARATERYAETTRRAEQRAQQARRRDTGILGTIGNILSDATVLGGRATLTAPQKAASARPADPRDPDEVQRQTTTTLGRIDKAFADLGRRVDRTTVGRFGKSWADNLDKADHASQRFFSTTASRFDRFGESVGTRAEATGRRLRTMLSSGSGDNRFLSRLSESAGSYFDKLQADAGKLGRPFRDAEQNASRFFRSIPRGAEDAARGLTTLRTKFSAFINDLNRPRADGSSPLKTIFGNIDALGDKLGGSLSGVRKHLFSFQTLIYAVIAAMGPLASILGGVGAAALGLASNIASLAGSLAALPGLIGAAVSGFGALALVMKPISGVFSAYSAAQKAATADTTSATKALYDYQRAQLGVQRAELTLARARQDLPRAQQKLNDSRKQAARDIEDYRLALQKLRFDEEGAQLGVESAEQEYRRSLADPTKSSLDRRVAQHGLEGAYFDQRDQNIQTGRTQQDAKEAIAKGVDGSDQVVSALRGVQDATLDIKDAELAYKEAILARKKAQKDSDAGGSAASAYQAMIDKLPEKTKKVVLALIALKGEYTKVRDRLSENIFGPISTETGKFKDLLNELSDFLTPASRAIGHFAKNALDLLDSPAWKKFFYEQGKESGYIIRQLGDALIHAADGFRGVTEVARPFTRFVVDGIKGMATAFDRFANSDKGREKIAWFLDITKKRMQELKPVLVNIVDGLGGFFKALNMGGKDDFTSWFNNGLLKASKTFADLGKKAQDPDGGFQKWLHNVKPLLHDIVTFLSQAGGFFGRMFSDQRNMEEARRILAEIGGKWLPALSDIFAKLSESGLVSKLAAGISGAFEGINSFFDHGGLSALSAFASALEAVGTAIDQIGGFLDRLTERFPVLDGVLKGIGKVFAVVFGAALIYNLLRIGKIIGGVISAAKGVGGIVGSIRDRDETSTKGKVTGDFQKKIDNAKDKLFGRDSGESAARRTQREEARRGRRTGAAGVPGGAGAPGVPPLDRTGTGGVIPHLTRMEKLLQQIRTCVCETAANTKGLSRGTGGRGAGSGHPSSTGNAVEQYHEDPNWRQSDRPRPTVPGNSVEPAGPNTRYVPGTGGPVERDELGTSRNRRGLPTGTTSMPELQAGPTRPALPPGRFDPNTQYPSGKPKPPTRPGLADAGRDLSVYPGLDDDYDVPQKGKPKRGKNGRFLPSKPNSPQTSLPYVGRDDSVYTDPDVKPAPRPSQFPSGTRRPPSKPVLADVGTPDLSVYPGLDDNYTVQKPRRRVGGRFAPDLPDRPALATPGRSNKPYIGLDDDYTVERPRGKKGRFLPRPGQQTFNPIDITGVEPSVRPMPATAPQRPLVPATTAPTPVVQSDRRNRTTAVEGEVLPPAASTEQPGQPRRERTTRVIEGTATETTPSRPSPSRPSTSGTPNLDVLSDIMNGGDGSGNADRTRRPGRARRGLGAVSRGLKKIFRPGDDAGYVQLGSRRRHTTTSRPGSRGRGAPVNPSILGDDEYDEGYADGLAAGGGSSGIDLPDSDDRERKPSRKERREARRNARRNASLGNADDVLEGDVLSPEEYDNVRRSRTTGTEQDDERARRRGLPGSEREGGRGRGLRRLFGRGAAAESRGLGGRLGGLTRLGGGLARGLAGGVVGAVGGFAAQMGGEYLTNKFVKNDEDAASLQRGLGAVTNGASIGATIGGFLPIPGGAVIGGALGGLAGGAYSLFKDKNLRNFVGGKLQSGAKAVGGALSGAAGAVGGFFGGAADKVGDFFSGGLKGAFGGLKGGDGKAGIGGVLAGLTGPLGLLASKTDIGKNIIDSLDKAGSGIANFFTKKIPDWFGRGIKAITTFFTRTLPSLPGKAFDAITTGIGVLIGFFRYDIPRAAERAWHGITTFFTKTLPNAASAAWKGITGFFTETLPNAAAAAWHGITTFFTETLPYAAGAAWKGITHFFTETLPNAASAVWNTITTFFTETLPHAAQTAWDNIGNFFTKTLPDTFQAIVDKISTFFSTTLPNFFTETLPNAISKLPGIIYDKLISPVVDFFGNLGDHVVDAIKGGWDSFKGWAKGIFDRGSANVAAGEATRKMSGGMIEGIYQGIQDTVHVMATPGEMFIRKGAVDQPGAKAFLADFNEGRITMADLYGGLSASVAPPVMSMVPPTMTAMNGRVPTVVNNTTNHAPIMGDVTIHNPVRERSEHSLRRQVQIAAIRHRR